MEQQILWMVAILGAGTLLGVFWRMKGGFGPMNLRAVGIVFIALLVCLLSIAKAGDMNAAMGILGAIAGYLFGAKAGDSEESESGSSVDASGATFGNAAKVAGRDINEMIENLQGDVKEIKDSVINQVLDSSGISDGVVTEFLFTTSFLKAREPINESAKAIRNLQRRGWSLFSIASGYGGDDGLVLVFRRVRPPGPGDESIDGNRYDIRVFHGIDEVELDYQ